MFSFIVLSLVASLTLLFGAAELERRAILDRRLGPNGRAMLAALAISALGSLVVIGVAAYSAGWVHLLHLLGGTILYHAVMGIALVHGLQQVSARVAGQPLRSRA